VLDLSDFQGVDMPAKKTNFTMKVIEKLEIPEKGIQDYLDINKKYLILRVTSKGLKTFYYRRKVDGRVRWVKLGVFPELNVFRARKKVDEKNGLVARGIDPADEKKDQRKVVTFGVLYKKFYELHSKPHKKSHLEDERRFRLYLQGWKNRKAISITREFVYKWQNQTANTGGKIQANRTLQLAKAVYNFAIKQGFYEGANPCAGIKLFKEKSRDRFMDAEELKRFFEGLESEPNPTMRDFFALALFTGARRSNLQSMKWEDLYLEKGVWVIPGEESKNSEPVKVILAPESIEILMNRKNENSRSSAYVFPSQRRDSKSPHMVEPKKAWKALCERANLRDLRIHDLRRTLGSWQAISGSSLNIIGKSLGHKDQATAAVYSRLNLDPIRNSVLNAIKLMKDSVKQK
jgi:integrase